MAGFGDLINKAIADQGAKHDAEARARIYSSSRSALERMLAANAAIDTAAADVQRVKLEEAIAELEAGFAKPAPVAPTADLPAQAAPVPPPQQQPVPTPPPVPRTNPVLASSAPPVPPVPSVEPRVTPPPPMPPSVSAPQRLEPAFEPPAPEVAPPIAASVAPPTTPDVAPSPSPQDDAVAPAVAPVVPPPNYSGDALKKRRPYAKWLAWIIILTGLGVAAWWAWTFGPQLLNERIQGSAANQESAITRGPFDPGEGWISVFDPASDPTAIVTENRGTAELIQRENGTVARLTSSNPGTTGNLLIRIPPGIVQQMRGKATTFEIVMAGAADDDQEVAIYCRFDALGSCGRKRFAVGRDTEAQIFDVLAEDTELPAGREAFLAINSDLGGKDRSVEVAGIRMRTGE